MFASMKTIYYFRVMQEQAKTQNNESNRLQIQQQRKEPQKI